MLPYYKLKSIFRLLLFNTYEIENTESLTRIFYIEQKNTIQRYLYIVNDYVTYNCKKYS